MDRDIINRVSQGRTPSVGAAAAAAIGILPVVLTTTALSAATNLAGFHGAMIEAGIGVFGTAASGSVFIECEVQECATTGGTYTAVADADLLFPPGDAARQPATAASGTFFCSKSTTNADLSGLYTVGYRGNKQFIKVNVRLTGTQSTGTPVSVVITAGYPDYAPTVGNAS